LPLRVCHLITDLDTGGAERSLVNLVTGMDQNKFECDVVSLIEPGAMARPLVEAGVPVTSLHMQRGRPSIAALFALIRHLRATRPAIVQTWLYHADLIGTLAALAARPRFLLWNVRCTNMAQDTDKPIKWLVRLLAMLSRRPDAIVVNSQQGQRDHESLGYRPRRWANIPNGVDLDHFRPRRSERATLRARLNLDPEAFTIGLVARDHPMKDVGTFLRAAALFIKHWPDAQFVLAGEGFAADNANLKSLIDRLELGDRVFLLGRRPDIDAIYPTFDIFTLCSIYGEGFPNVVCEAMACGLPCVGTAVGDTAEIIGDCGLIVPTHQPERLAEAWEALCTRGIESTGAAARVRVAARYGLDRMREQYEALYLSLSGASCS
jgi:glycosyltransferase involved in cell wall biosynthesis